MLNGEWDEAADLRRPIQPSQMGTPRTGVDASLGKARRDALRLLSYRARSQAEVRSQLDKSYPSAVVEEVLEQLVAQGYLNDAAFAMEWRRSREEHRPRSRQVLEHELLRRGVERETVRDALADFDDAGNAYRAALRLAQRLSDSEYPAFQARVWRYLHSRGFQASVISDVVNRLWRELADPHHRAVYPDSQEQKRKDAQRELVNAPTDDERQGHGAAGNPGQS